MRYTFFTLIPVRGVSNAVDQRTYEFEGAMIGIMTNKSFYPAGLESAPNLQRSFTDVVGSTIIDDVKLLAAGLIIMSLREANFLKRSAWWIKIEYITLS